ncbi:hypothetical protein FACS1894172_07310 [Spirochaetia bacterium]|nr:hypothetical protein FACS1894164_17020 [Spirochaetia bacterium]GHU31803.1 hypothetical protein FACS1894172_07310 [Spirochaetia bacterium]
MSNVLIIGAGIAGLSAGIYARKSRFDVMMCEAHSIAGGNCTSWRRKGYLFEGGLHWLTGSGMEQPLHKVWREVGALRDESRITNGDPFMVCDWHGQRVSLYRDNVKLETHLCEVSPEDMPRIRELCRDIRRFSSFAMPVTDIPRLKVSEKSPSIIPSGLKMLPALARILPLSALSVTDYAARFRHPAIRLLLMSVVNPNYDAVALLVTLGCFASGDGGYLEGGSLTLTANMVKRFEELGGIIRYNTKVTKVQIVNGRACGVVAGGETIRADAVIITSDTLTAIDTFFDVPLREKWMRTMCMNMNRNGVLLMCSFVSIGVETDLSDLPESMTFPLEKPIEHAGQRITHLAYKLYADSAGYAPKGCSAITLIITGNTYDYWKQARDQGCYDEHKKELFEQICTALEKQLPAIKGKVAVWDVATPLTYERYCGTWHGSWMTITPPGTKRVFYPCRLKHIGNLYFAGQRIMPPGGTPPAVSTGRTAVQYLCRDFGAVFQS